VDEDDGYYAIHANLLKRHHLMMKEHIPSNNQISFHFSTTTLMKMISIQFQLEPNSLNLRKNHLLNLLFSMSTLVMIVVKKMILISHHQNLLLLKRIP
jgi:hypothetical protein